MAAYAGSAVVENGVSVEAIIGSVAAILLGAGGAMAIPIETTWVRVTTNFVIMFFPIVTAISVVASLF